MKIGFDAKRAFKNRTGLGNYSRNLIGGIAETNENIAGILYTPDTDGPYSNYFSMSRKLRVIMPKGFARFFPHLWRTCGISFRLRSDRVNIYHGLSNELPYFVPKNVKQVVTVHDLIDWRYPELYNKSDRHIYRKKMRHACKNADIIVAASQQTKRDLQELLQVPEEKIRVIYQTCDSMFWHSEIDEVRDDVRKRYKLPQKYIISVGTIEKRKNQLAAVEALSNLPEELHLVIVGGHRTDYYDSLMDTVTMLRLEDRVHILENAIFDDFPALYSNAIMSMYVSEFEGFGIPVLESMCCDTPVITSNVSSMPEVAGEAALYVDPKDVVDITSKALQLYNDENLRRQLVEKGRVQREKFNTEVISRQMIDLYKELAR